MADLASFWAGSSLGPIEIASARSFLRHGDRQTVHAPGPIANLPDGVILGEANEILPSERILHHRKSGSPALHADLFRYALLNSTDRMWVDLEIITLRAFDFPSPWVFAFEDLEGVNNVVLRLPPGSKALNALSAFRADTMGIPPHIGGRRWLNIG